jgi:hypothetical protein
MKWFHHAIVPSLILGEIVVLLLPVQTLVWLKAFTFSWLKAIGYLDPSYVTGEEPTLSWAIATFATLGVLLALVVPKIIDFDRDIIKQMGFVTHPRSFLYCLKQTNSTKLKKLFEFTLNVNWFYVVLCIILYVFIFNPSFRGIWAVFVFMYSGLLLHSIQFMAQEEEFEVLLLNNIKDKEVKSLLKKYVGKVYSTQGHPRQEDFYQELDHGDNGFYTLIRDKRFEEYVLGKQLNEEIIRNFFIHKITISPALTKLMGSSGLYPFSNVHTGYETHFYRSDVIEAWFSYFKNLLILSKDKAELREHILSNLESTLRPSRNTSVPNSFEALFFKYNANYTQRVASLPNPTLELLPYSSQSASSSCLVFSEKYVNSGISAYYFALTAGLFAVGFLYERKEIQRLQKFLRILCDQSPETLLKAMLIVASACYIDNRGGDFFFGKYCREDEISTGSYSGWVNPNIEHPQIGATLLSLMAFKDPSISAKSFARQVKDLIEVYPYLKDIFRCAISTSEGPFHSCFFFGRELLSQGYFNMQNDLYRTNRINRLNPSKRFSPYRFIDAQRFSEETFSGFENHTTVRDYLQAHFLERLEAYCNKKHPHTKHFRRLKRLFEKIPFAFWDAPCFDKTFTTTTYEYKPTLFTPESLQGLNIEFGSGKL